MAKKPLPFTIEMFNQMLESKLRPMVTPKPQAAQGGALIDQLLAQTVQYTVSNTSRN